MANFLNTITTKLKSLLGRKPQPMSKDKFKEMLSLTSQSLQTFVTNVNAFAASDQKALAKKINAIKPKDYSPGLKAYIGFRGKLKNEAYKDETTKTFEALKKTSSTILSILEKLDKSVDDIFEGKSITIYNVTIGQSLVFGVLREADVYSRFATYIVNAILLDINRSMGDVPKYRVGFLTENAQNVANTTNKIYTKSGMYIFQTAVENLKKTNCDIRLMNENIPDSTANLAMLRTDRINSESQQLITEGFKTMGVFIWAAEMWNLYQHNKYLKNKAEKEWLEAHIALLKLELAGSTDEAQKAKLEKIIAAYNAQLSKLDKAIDGYVGDE